MLSTLAMLSMRSISQAKSETWTYRKRMPTARTAPGGCVLDRRIFVTGGAVNGSALTAAVEVYDPTSDTWTESASLPSPFTCHATCSYDGKIFAIGGSYPCPQPTMFSTVEAYELVPETTLGVVRTGNSKLELHWQIAGPPSGSGLVLQAAEAPQGPWSDLILDAQSPVVIEATEPIKLYRIRTVWHPELRRRESDHHQPCSGERRLL